MNTREQAVGIIEQLLEDDMCNSQDQTESVQKLLADLRRMSKSLGVFKR